MAAERPATEGILKRLREEHDQVRELFAKMEDTSSRATKSREKLLGRLRELLIPHMEGEEKVLYDRLKQSAEADEERTTVLEGFEEHRHGRAALKRLEQADPKTPDWPARLSVLKELVEHHAEEEEKEMFELARERLGAEQLAELDDAYRERSEKARQRIS